jgi:phosphomannomutase
MPEISRFYGIIISIFYDEHNPPHFHARYGDHNLVLAINDFRVLEGFFPARALGLVTEWAALHQEELLKDWKLAEKNIHPEKIEPLK